MMSNAIERLRHAVRTLPGVLTRFSEAESEERSSPERWTKKEVVGHLIDSASNNHQRFVRGQLDAGQDFPRYEQEGWVRVQNYQAARWADLIDLWRAYNAHLLHVAACMSADGRRAVCRVGGGAEVTLERLFADYIDHLEHHLRKMLGAWEVGGAAGRGRPARGGAGGRRMAQSIAAVALVVADYDEAIHFFTDRLRFALAEDTPVAPGKRWVTVRPPGGRTALLLARAVTAEQAARVGDQAGGRVFLFLQTDDCWRDYEDFRGRGVRFAEEPREEAYGTVAVFLDLYGNRWDLVQPRSAGPADDGVASAGVDRV